MATWTFFRVKIGTLFKTLRTCDFFVQGTFRKLVTLDVVLAVNKRRLIEIVVTRAQQRASS